MKKTLVIIVALSILASCVNQFTEEPESLTFTAQIISGSTTRTTLDTSTGKQAWETGDEITITDGANTAVYSVKSITGGIASFKKKSGDNLQTSGVTYEATYGFGSGLQIICVRA